jgi:hypothetical protein
MKKSKLPNSGYFAHTKGAGRWVMVVFTQSRGSRLDHPSHATSPIERWGSQDHLHLFRPPVYFVYDMSWPHVSNSHPLSNIPAIHFQSIHLPIDSTCFASPTTNEWPTDTPLALDYSDYHLWSYSLLIAERSRHNSPYLYTPINVRLGSVYILRVSHITVSIPPLLLEHNHTLH